MRSKDFDTRREVIRAEIKEIDEARDALSLRYKNLYVQLESLKNEALRIEQGVTVFRDHKGRRGVFVGWKHYQGYYSEPAWIRVRLIKKNGEAGLVEAVFYDWEIEK